MIFQVDIVETAERIKSLFILFLRQVEMLLTRCCTSCDKAVYTLLFTIDVFYERCGMKNEIIFIINK